MTNKYETVDLGSVKGDKGETGIKGRGIDGISDKGYIDVQNPLRHYYNVRYDDGSEPFTFYITDGEDGDDGIDMVADNTITSNSQNPVKSSALYTRFTSIENEIDALKNRNFIHIVNGGVNSLPTGANIDKSGIYLVPSSEESTKNEWEEYVYSDGLGDWEHLGAFNINLNDYYDKTTIDGKISSNVYNDRSSTTKFPSTKATYDFITSVTYNKTEIDNMIGSLQDFIHS